MNYVVTLYLDQSMLMLTRVWFWVGSWLNLCGSFLGYFQVASVCASVPLLDRSFLFQDRKLVYSFQVFGMIKVSSHKVWE